MAKQKLNAREMKFRTRQQVASKFTKHYPWWCIATKKDEERAVEELVKKVVR